MAPPLWIDLLAPGSGLVLRDRLLAGVLLLLLAMLTIAVFLLSGALTMPPLLGQLRWIAGLVFGGLVLVAWCGDRWADRRRLGDATTVRELHRRCAQALLTGQATEAVRLAEELTRHAPDLPGSWRLLASVATGVDEARCQIAHQRMLRVQTRLSEH